MRLKSFAPLKQAPGISINSWCLLSCHDKRTHLPLGLLFPTQTHDKRQHQSLNVVCFICRKMSPLKRNVSCSVLQDFEVSLDCTNSIISQFISEYIDKNDGADSDVIVSACQKWHGLGFVDWYCCPCNFSASVANLSNDRMPFCDINLLCCLNEYIMRVIIVLHFFGQKRLQPVIYKASIGTLQLLTSSWSRTW